MYTRDAAWAAAVETLKDYANRTGSTFPDQSAQTADGRSLRSWTINVRVAQRTGTLPPDLVQELEDIPGWKWRVRARRGTGPRTRSTPRRVSWDERMDAVERYVAEHGVLPSYRSGRLEERSLRLWLYLQRKADLTPQRRARVERVDDAALTPEWRPAFNAVLQAYGTPAAVHHHRWLKQQFMLANSGALTAEQQRLLGTVPSPYLTRKRGRPRKADVTGASRSQP